MELLKLEVLPIISHHLLLRLFPLFAPEVKIGLPPLLPRGTRQFVHMYHAFWTATILHLGETWAFGREWNFFQKSFEKEASGPGPGPGQLHCSRYSLHLADIRLEFGPRKSNAKIKA